MRLDEAKELLESAGFICEARPRPWREKPSRRAASRATTDILRSVVDGKSIATTERESNVRRFREQLKEEPNGVLIDIVDKLDKEHQWPLGAGPLGNRRSSSYMAFWLESALDYDDRICNDPIESTCREIKSLLLNIASKVSRKINYPELIDSYGQDVCHVTWDEDELRFELTIFTDDFIQYCGGADKATRKTLETNLLKIVNTAIAELEKYDDVIVKEFRRHNRNDDK